MLCVSYVVPHKTPHKTQSKAAPLWNRSDYCVLQKAGNAVFDALQDNEKKGWGKSEANAQWRSEI